MILQYAQRALLLLLILTTSAWLTSAQRVTLPPISWSCPMHADVIEDHKDKCPICGMDLVQVRLDYVWSCPVHAVIDEASPGKCPICRRDLVRVTTALTWSCPDNPKVDQINPGKCADGSAMIPRHTARAHGNHNPQHGGSFFMASDNWHHLEGTFPSANVLRLYVYDDYSKPLAPDDMKLVQGTATRGKAVSSFRLSADGKYLEADVPGLAPSTDVTAKVRFKDGGEEYRFDFNFPAFSHESGTTQDLAGVPSMLLPVDIPDKTSEILAMLRERNGQIRDLIEKGSFGEIYVPAFQAKDLALALDLRTAELPATRKSATAAAVERVVRNAWLLDSYGDLGDRTLIEAAYNEFAAAVAELEAAFSAGKKP